MLDRWRTAREHRREGHLRPGGGRMTDAVPAPTIVSRVWTGRTPGYRIRTPLNGWRHPRDSEPSPGLVEAIVAAAAPLGGFGSAVRPGDTVLLKPNFNSGDPPPNSTDVPFLVAMIRLLRDHGARRVIVGESSRHPPTSTRFEMNRTGVIDACAREGAEVAIFPEGEWAPVYSRGRYFRTLEIARPLLECDRLVYACCLKTHWLSKFTASIKHSVGCARPRSRAQLHFGGHFEERVAEIAATITPDLVLIDARQVYVRGGPCYGLARSPGVILAGRDRVALDVEGIKLLQRYRECALSDDPWSYGQIREAIRLGLGVTGPEEYRVIDRSLARLIPSDDPARAAGG